MIHQQSGETATNYFDRFKLSQVNEELSKLNLTKHEELDKSERGDGDTTNPEKLAEDKFLDTAFLECSIPERYKTLWYSLRNNSLTGEYHHPKTFSG